jgi:hypothetical protein
MFVQLTPDDCTYLLNLIEEMDSDTAYTSRQRGYTVPKLQKIQANGRAARLAFQDVDYLLELIDDDDLAELEQSREMARCQLLDIQNLQNQKFEESKNVEQQRESRRLRRLGPAAVLAEHFEHTAPVVSD